MAHIQEIPGFFNTSNTVCTVTVPAGGIPVGALLILGIGTNAATLPTITVTDAAGNTWSNDGEIQTAASGSTHQFRAVVGNSLAAGQLITVTFAAALSKCAVSVQQFDDGIIAIDGGSNGNSGGASSNTPTTGAFTPTHASALLVATFGLVSAGRVFTAGGSYTAGTKVATTSGAGDRAVVMEWQYVSVIASYVGNGTLNSSSLYGAVARSYALGTPGASGGTGKAKVFVGGAWTSHPFKTWNGTAWQTHLGKRWDGTAWIPIT
jgi:hypothetical protein